jgi:hypothetical protein
MPPIRYEYDDFELTIGITTHAGRGAAGEGGGGSPFRLLLGRDLLESVRRLWLSDWPRAEAYAGDALFDEAAAALPPLREWALAQTQIGFDWVMDQRRGVSVLRYRTPRLLLHLEDRDLILLPWEALFDFLGNPILVIRRPPAVPAMTGQKPDLPLHLAQVGLASPAEEAPFDLVPMVARVFGRHAGREMAGVIQRRLADDLSGIESGRGPREALPLPVPAPGEGGPPPGTNRGDDAEGWDRTDVLHLTVRSFEGGGEEGALAGRIELAGGTFASSEELGAWLARQRTRLLVLHLLPREREARTRLLLLAHDLASHGGPPALVAHFPNDRTAARDFFTHFYNQLIHDTPIDFGQILLYDGDYIPRPPREQRWLQAHLPLIAASGSEELLRFSSLLFDIADRRETLYTQAERQRQWLARFAGWLEEKQTAEGAPEPAVDRFLDPGLTARVQKQVGQVTRLRNRLDKLAAGLVFDPRHEGDSSIPMVRSRGEVEKAGTQLETATEKMRQAVAERLARYVNTWFAAGEGPDRGQALPPEFPLVQTGRYLLHVDIGPREVQGIVTNPVNIAPILDELYDLHDEQGVTLEVGLFSQDFWVGPARQEPAVPHQEWRRPREEWPTVDYAWQQPRSGIALDYLWLSRLNPSRPLYFSLKAKRSGLCRLRLCVYYRNNLLQSLLIEARVSRTEPGYELEQISGIGAGRAAQLAAAGIRTFPALANATPPAVVAATGGGERQAQRWIETALRLAELGTEARIEYTTNPDFAAIAETPRRSLTLFANSDGNSHWVGVKMGEWDEQGKKGDDWTYQGSLSEAALTDILTGVRCALTEASSILSGGEPSDYAFDDQNRGTIYNLGQALYRLAVQGRQLYSAFFEAPAQDELEKRLSEADQTIHVARVVGGYVVPWAVVYDRPLAYEQTWRPKYVCLHALAQRTAGRCEGCPGGNPAALAGAQKTQVLDRNQDPDGVDVYAYDDPSVCALAGHGAQDVVCPWGFWGLKHRLEQPPQRLTEDKPDPRALKTRVKVAGPPVLNMNVSTTLDFARDRSHLARLQKLARAGQVAVIAYAGEDQPGRLGVDDVVQTLHRADLPLIYFYCHGGAVRAQPQSALEAFLAVGSSDRYQIRPGTLDNEKYWWANAPLVLINACKSAALEPALLGDFVQKFAEHGAAGVIGTEVSVWEPLAVEVAESFFQAFLQGDPVGKILLDLRHRLLQKYNPLGLIYTNYCSADLRVS